MSDTTTQTIPKPFRHHLLLGTAPDGNVFVSVEFDKEGELHMTGVVGPKANGDARGSCGQCIDSVRACKPLAPFTEADRDWLVVTWERWHLNHMKAGCEHQRAEQWDKLPIDPNKPLNAYGKHCGQDGPTTWNMLSWVTRRDHPQGLLSEPCPTCGYKWGTAWLKESVPIDVIERLRSLPTTNALPTCWAR